MGEIGRMTTYIVRNGTTFRVVFDGTGAALSVSAKSAHGLERFFNPKVGRGLGIARAALAQMRRRQLAFERGGRSDG